MLGPISWPSTASGGVSSLNSLTGALSLVAGSGITVTPSGSNITIAASGGGGASIGGAVTGGTAGSLLFVNPSAILDQDNSFFFYDKATKRFRVNTKVEDGTGASVQVLAAAGALTTASNVVVSFNLNASGYLVADGTNWVETVYNYFTLNGVTYRDAVGSTGSAVDPNDGQTYDLVVSFTPPGSSTSGFIVYESVGNHWTDIGGSTSISINNTTIFTGGTPPITPANFPSGVGISIIGGGSNALKVVGGANIDSLVSGPATFNGNISATSWTGNFNSLSTSSNFSGVTGLFTSTLSVKHYSAYGLGGTPTVAAGAGAGTGPTISVSGAKDSRGAISVTTGTTPTGSNAIIATVTFNAAYTAAPLMFLQPANSATAALTGAVQVYVTSTTTTFVLTSGASALTASTAYKWNFWAIQ